MELTHFGGHFRNKRTRLIGSERLRGEHPGAHYRVGISGRRQTFVYSRKRCPTGQTDEVVKCKTERRPLRSMAHCVLTDAVRRSRFRAHDRGCLTLG